MVDIWLGDSWTVGAELLGLKSYPPTKNIPNLKFGDDPYNAFPHIVSSARQKEYFNFACDASSIEFSVTELLNFFNSNLYNKKENYTVFFCLTEPTRLFWRGHKQIEYFLTQKQYGSNMWEYVEETAIIRAAAFINTAYLACMQKNINMWIIPIFCTLEESNILQVPENIWLSKESLTKTLYNFNIPDNKLDDPFLNFDWKTPHVAHPNKQSHQELAQLILNYLKHKN